MIRLFKEGKIYKEFKNLDIKIRKDYEKVCRKAGCYIKDDGSPFASSRSLQRLREQGYSMQSY